MNLDGFRVGCGMRGPFGLGGRQGGFWQEPRDWFWHKQSPDYAWTLDMGFRLDMECWGKYMKGEGQVDSLM